MSEEYRPTQKMQGPGSGPSQPTPQAAGEYHPTMPMSERQQFGPAQASYPGAKTEVLRSKGPMALAWLAIIDGPHMGHIFRLHPDATVIGRDPGCDVVVDDAAASRQHAKIRAVEGESKQPRFVLHDLATENGTLVNDQEIAKYELEDGDYIKIGRTELVFKQVLPRKQVTSSAQGE
jgi:hypothetical protein